MTGRECFEQEGTEEAENDRITHLNEGVAENGSGRGEQLRIADGRRQSKKRRLAVILIHFVNLHRRESNGCSIPRSG